MDVLRVIHNSQQVLIETRAAETLPEAECGELCTSRMSMQKASYVITTQMEIMSDMRQGAFRVYLLSTLHCRSGTDKT